LFYNPLTNNTITFRRPRFTHEFAQAGKYLVAVRSTAGAGSPDHAYLLRIAQLDPAQEATLDRWLPHKPVCKDPGNWDERVFERGLKPDRLQALAARSAPAAKKEAVPVTFAKDAMTLGIPALVEGVIAK